MRFIASTKTADSVNFTPKRVIGFKVVKSREILLGQYSRNFGSFPGRAVIIVPARTCASENSREREINATARKLAKDSPRAVAKYNVANRGYTIQGRGPFSRDKLSR